MNHLKISGLFVLLAFLFCSCSALSSRPARQMSYAEAAYQAAQLAGAETLQPNLFQLSKDALLQARAAYRLKNFKLARQLCIKARHAAEDAEFKSLQAAANGAGEGGGTKASGEKNL